METEGRSEKKLQVRMPTLFDERGRRERKNKKKVRRWRGGSRGGERVPEGSEAARRGPEASGKGKVLVDKCFNPS